MSQASQKVWQMEGQYKAETIATFSYIWSMLLCFTCVSNHVIESVKTSKSLRSSVEMRVDRLVLGGQVHQLFNFVCCDNSTLRLISLQWLLLSTPLGCSSAFHKVEGQWNQGKLRIHASISLLWRQCFYFFIDVPSMLFTGTYLLGLVDTIDWNLNDHFQTKYTRG